MLINNDEEVILSFYGAKAHAASPFRIDSGSCCQFKATCKIYIYQKHLIISSYTQEQVYQAGDLTFNLRQVAGVCSARAGLFTDRALPRRTAKCRRRRADGGGLCVCRQDSALPPYPLSTAALGQLAAINLDPLPGPVRTHTNIIAYTSKHGAHMEITEHHGAQDSDPCQGEPDGMYGFSARLFSFRPQQKL